MYKDQGRELYEPFHHKLKNPRPHKEPRLSRGRLPNQAYGGSSVPIRLLGSGLVLLGAYLLLAMLFWGMRNKMFFKETSGLQVAESKARRKSPSKYVSADEKEPTKNSRK